MNEKILTPLLLWEHYNPVKEKFDLTFKRQYVVDGIKIRECYFTVKTLADGKIRGYMAMAIPSDVGKTELSGEKAKFPAVITVEDIDDDPDLDKAIKTAKSGAVGVIVDYSGKRAKKTGFTSYPDSLKYCNVVENDSRIWRVDENIQEATWYVWAQVLRRALSVLCSQTFIDKDKIALIGKGYATTLAWQVGTMDGRISAMIAVNGAGWNGYGEKMKYAESDELSRWLVGIAAQAYIPFVHCPTLIIAPTNSVVTNFEKLFENISYISNKNKVDFICIPNQRGQIDKQSADNIEYWLKLWYGGLKYPKTPEIKFKNKDKGFVLEGKCDISELRVKSAEFYYAYGEKNSSLRQWHKSTCFEKESGEYVSEEIEYIDNTENVYAFMNIEYDKEILVSSRELIIPPNKDTDMNVVRRKRKIYAKNHNFDEFISCDLKSNTSGNRVELKIGDKDIEGISVSGGNLESCIFSDSRYRGIGDSILQFDVCAKTGTKITVSLFAEENGEEMEYTSTKTVSSDNWEKFSFSPADFKNKDLISLKEWNDVKKISFIDAKDYIINNILWI